MVLLETPQNLTQLVPLFQAALSPITVISGVGLLVLSITNRYGRVIDRLRSLIHQRKTEALTPNPHPLLEQQLAIMLRRAKLLRWSVFFALLSVFLVAVTICLLYAGLLPNGILGQWVSQGVLTQATGQSFLAALIALLVALGLFMQDITLSLKAVMLEVAATTPSTTLPEGLQASGLNPEASKTPAP